MKKKGFKYTDIGNEEGKQKERPNKIVGAGHDGSNDGFIYGESHFGCQFQEEGTRGVVSARAKDDRQIQD